MKNQTLKLNLLNFNHEPKPIEPDHDYIRIDFDLYKEKPISFKEKYKPNYRCYFRYSYICLGALALKIYLLFGLQIVTFMNKCKPSFK